MVTSSLCYWQVSMKVCRLGSLIDSHRIMGAMRGYLRTATIVNLAIFQLLGRLKINGPLTEDIRQTTKNSIKISIIWCHNSNETTKMNSYLSSKSSLFLTNPISSSRTPGSQQMINQGILSPQPSISSFTPNAQQTSIFHSETGKLLFANPDQ